jgi:hypothetical protein
MQYEVKTVRLECFRALWKVQNEVIPTVPRRANRVVEGIQTPRVKATTVPKCAQLSQEKIWESGGEEGDGAGKRDVHRTRRG